MERVAEQVERVATTVATVIARLKESLSATRITILMEHQRPTIVCGTNDVLPMRTVRITKRTLIIPIIEAVVLTGASVSFR